LFTRTSRSPELSFYYLGFNTRKPPFDDVNVRLAFCHAVDKKKIASLVYRDMVAPADGILPPEMPGHNAGLQGLDYDLDQARELIKNSRYGSVANLPPIVVTDAGEGGQSQRSGGHHLRVAENLGVDVTVREIELERFYNLDRADNVSFSAGWATPHPQDFWKSCSQRLGDQLRRLLQPRGGRLLDRANLELDRNKSLALYREAEQKLVDDGACLPLWFGKNYVLVKPYVKGFEANQRAVNPSRYLSVRR
jgi:oligopeptide transport system substrate-binding protein